MPLIPISLKVMVEEGIKVISLNFWFIPIPVIWKQEIILLKSRIFIQNLNRRPKSSLNLMIPWESKSTIFWSMWKEVGKPKGSDLTT